MEKPSLTGDRCSLIPCKQETWGSGEGGRSRKAPHCLVTDKTIRPWVQSGFGKPESRLMEAWDRGQATMDPSLAHCLSPTFQWLWDLDGIGWRREGCNLRQSPLGDRMEPDWEDRVAWRAKTE